MRGLDALRRHGVDWNALTTVNSANGHSGLEVYRFLRDDLGATFVQLIPIVERVTPELLPLAEAGRGTRVGNRPLYRKEGDRVTDRTVSAQQWGRFLVEVFEEWPATTSVTSSCRCSTHRWRTGWAWTRSGCASTPRTCGDAVALEHNGDLYSCDHYVEPGYLLGIIAEGPHCSSRSTCRSSGRSAGRSWSRCRSTAAPEECASRATAAAPRTASR
ncbi:hypothetical protein [Nostocoides sp. F2B08]|uniref:hypothetical protein n=1 Tax=Nostocoides sp. F2B08 TaxID=2653936 RepID=UPI001D0487F2|nr:hypothetical protein [Tetrasphaera sp. F2B08]